MEKTLQRKLLKILKDIFFFFREWNFHMKKQNNKGTTVDRKRRLFDE